MLLHLQTASSNLHHRSGDLETPVPAIYEADDLHHRSGDLERCRPRSYRRHLLHHRSGDLEIEQLRKATAE